MKPLIIIIEDTWSECQEIISNLSMQDIYQFIPKDVNEFNEIRTKIQHNEIYDFLRETIEKNYENIVLITMDLELDGHKDAGSECVHFIRNSILLPEQRLFPKLVPIIVVTNYSESDFAKTALRNGATHNISKSIIKSVHFSTIVESMINYFNTAYNNRDLTYLETELNDVVDKLTDNKKIIKSGFNNIEILINARHDETLSNFNLLFKSFFSSLENDKQKRVFDKFRTELSYVLDEETISSIKQSTWDKIKGSIKDFGSGGGFKAFVDTTYDILNEGGLLGSKEKLVGIAIKGVLEAISSSH